MKIITKSLIIGIVLTFLFSMIPFTSQCENISSELFRLHILANSDSESDQELKLKVRDKILDYTKNLYKASATKSETIKITKDNLDNILSVANEEVKRLGYSYKVNGKITRMFFNTRTYGDYTIPSGTYDALRITIGKGEGHNWWCVMYPSFCLGESTDLQNSTLTDNDKELISDNSGYKIKFQIVEWIEKLKSYFKY
ncbi:MAG: stage II sporulation protein R [Oscillospiraceae bacterium]|nr:stage II sporulation protein R [Oscillospiraceae bacterium]